MYLKHGFHPIETGSGYMEYYGGRGVHDSEWTKKKRDRFEEEWFPSDSVSEVTIEHLAWKHYPVLPPLFLYGKIRGVVRASPLNLIGRISSELPFIKLIDEELKRIDKKDLHQVQILSHKNTGAVVGIGVENDARLTHFTGLCIEYSVAQIMLAAGAIRAGVGPDNV